VLLTHLAALQALSGGPSAPPAPPAQAPHIHVQYSASAGSVTDGGLYLAPPSAAPAVVTARSRGLTSTVRVIVVKGDSTKVKGDTTGTSPRPTQGGPWLDEDFSRYTSADQYRSNPFGWMAANPPRWFNQSRISVDTTQGYEGSRQSLRYDWRGNGREGCSKDITIATSYKAPPASEVWIEVVHKFATTFNTNVIGTGGVCKFGEYKFLLMWRPTGDRFDLINGHMGRQWWSGNPETPAFGRPPDCSGFNYNCSIPALGSNPLWDGQWHVYRVHIRFNSASGVPDGVFEIWVDGKPVKSRRNIDMTDARSHKWANRLSEIFLGGNSNSGTGQPARTWWGRLRIYTSDPHW
jgi:hypothetical protein